jgi:hypothetical protein
LLVLIEEAGLALFERQGRFFQFEDGQLKTDAWEESLFDVLERLPEDGDWPFAEFLARQRLPAKAAARVKS